MSLKTLLTLSASLLLGAAIAAPNAALAQFGPPPGPPPMLAGPPPGLGAGGPPPGLAGGPQPGGAPAEAVAGFLPRGGAGIPPRDPAGSPRLDGLAGQHGFDRGGQAGLLGVEARATAYGANSYTRNSYASAGYGHGYGRGYNGRTRPLRLTPSRSYASSEDGCTYVSIYRRYGTRRVPVCHGD